jgi:hypothetical protein
MNEAVVQEFTEQEAVARDRSKQLEPSSRPLRQNWSDLSDSGRVTGECWGPVGP